MKITKISNGVKKLILIFLALVLFIAPGLILADNSTTIGYLQNQSQNAWISQALASAKASGIDISYIDYSTNDLFKAAKYVLALAAIDSENSNNINQLLSVIVSSKNNGQFGSADLLNDDFWAVLALASVNQLAGVEDVKYFITNHQNSDGGWSWSVSGTSDSNDTAAAIMALSDLGYNSASSEIVSALNYLATTQNDDGGFGYDGQSLSDGASTAWVIATLNKLNINASDWQKGINNPISFLESLRQEDGSFLWMASDEAGSAMVTPYALLALTGGTYPVNYISLGNNLSGYSLRIEGPDNTICLASNLEASTVLDILEAGASVCGYQYVVTNTDYGPYVSSIGGVDAQGLDGWQYFVDFEPGTVAAGNYNLEGHREVLWAYGGWPFYAARLEVNDTHFEVGENLTANLSYYDGNSWLPISGANVVFGEEIYQTNSFGQFDLTLNNQGVFVIYSQSADNYARSNREYILVGDGISRMVDLSVEIKSGAVDPGNGDFIAFSVDRSSIDFGLLQPGQSADTFVSITNTGATNIYIEASILGDQVFQDFTTLDQNSWQDYSLNLNTAASESVNVALSIPQGFSSLGTKEGQLVFWGVSQ